MMAPRKVVHPLMTALTSEVATVVFRGMVTIVCFYGGVFYAHAKDLYQLPERMSAQIALVDQKLQAYETARVIAKDEVDKTLATWVTQHEAMQRELEQHDKALAVMSGQMHDVLDQLTKITQKLNLNWDEHSK